MKADDGVSPVGTIGDIDATPGLPPMDEDITPARAAPEGNITLEAMGKLLDEKLSPMNATLKALLTDFESFKTKMQAELAAMGLRMKQAESQDTAMQAKMQKLEDEVQAMKLGSKAEIMKQLTEAKSAVQTAKADQTIVVVGNIPGASTIEQAKAWLSKRCVEAGAPVPADSQMFVKSEDGFKGILFAKSLSVSHRDCIIEAVRNVTGDFAQKPWAKVDQPIDLRMAQSALFAFKRMLVTDWKYSKRCVWVDTNVNELSVAGTTVLKAVVENYELKLSWLDGEWETWEDLQSAKAFVDLKDSAQEKLNLAKAASKDAKGKGKSLVQ